jgi:hypothetical protein
MALHACAIRQSPARNVFSSTCRCALQSRSVARGLGPLGPLLALPHLLLLLLLLLPGAPGELRAGLPAAAVALPRMASLGEPAGALATKQVVSAPDSLR